MKIDGIGNALGVPLISLLLGYAIVRLWLWAERSLNPGRFVVVAVLLWPLMFFARAYSVYLPRPLVWYGLVPYGVYLVISRQLQARKNAPAQSRLT